MTRAVPLGGEIVVAASGTIPDVAFGADSEFAVTWVGDSLDGDYFVEDVSVRRFDHTGMPLDNRVVLGTGDEYDRPWAPRIAHDRGDNYIVVWFQDIDFVGQVVIAGILDAHDGSLVRVSILSDNRALNPSRPDVRCTSPDECLVVWSSDAEMPEDRSDYDIVGRRVSTVVGPTAERFRVNTGTSQRHVYPSVAALADGEFVVAWNKVSSRDATPVVREIAAQRIDIDGVATGDELSAPSDTTNPSIDAAVARDGAGGFVTVWQTRYGDGTVSGIFGQRFDAEGSHVGTEFQVNGATPEWVVGPSVAPLTAGGFVVSWARGINEDGSISSGDRGIFARTYGANAQPDSAEFRVDTESYLGGGYARVAGGDHDDFAVVWSARGGSIRLRRMTRDPLCGDPTGDGQRTATDALGVLRSSVKLEPCVACLCDVDTSGSVTVVDALRLLQSLPDGTGLECPACS